MHIIYELTNLQLVFTPHRLYAVEYSRPPTARMAEEIVQASFADTGTNQAE